MANLYREHAFRTEVLYNIFTDIIHFDILIIGLKEDLLMKGKFVVFIILILTIIVLILGWLWLENVITDYDIDRASANMLSDIF